MGEEGNSQILRILRCDHSPFEVYSTPRLRIVQKEVDRTDMAKFRLFNDQSIGVFTEYDVIMDGD